jgi:uncharacterized phage protein (TIGR01671 family)
MSREFKFRGISIETNEFVYGYIIQVESGKCYIFNYHLIPAVSCPYEKFIEVKPETVGQDTGLKDKNGKKIYEGDIIWFGGLFHKNGKKDLSVVGWDSDELRYFVHHYSFFGDSHRYCQSFLVEVIGNIHENKNLLTNK